MSEETILFKSVDDIELEGTLTIPASPGFKKLVILTPGIDVDREEEGFYTALANRLAEASIASFRYEWRCHGHDKARPLSKLTLAGLYNDIDAAVRTAKSAVDPSVEVTLVAASFSGGVAANWYKQNGIHLNNLILLAPILDYAHEYITRANLGSPTGLNSEAEKSLAQSGYLESWGKRFSPQIIKEFFTLPIALPQTGCYILHGGKDQGVDISIPKSFIVKNPNTRLFVLEGADHGFCTPEDQTSITTASKSLQQAVFQEIISFVKTGQPSGNIPEWHPKT